MNAVDHPDDEIALFVAMPERHLVSAAALDPQTILLPVGRLGDLPRTPPGSHLYVVVLDDQGVAAPAATWRGTFAGWTEPGEEKEGAVIPPTWLAEREAAAIGDEDAGGADGTANHEDEEGDEDEADDEDRPRQVFIATEALVPLDRRDWVFANEVVPKQPRGARSFVPMTPTLVRLPD
jgi:hypothetical protein